MLARDQGAHSHIRQSFAPLDARRTSSDTEGGLELDPRAPHTQPGLFPSCKLLRKCSVLQKFSFLKSTSGGSVLCDGSVGKLPVRTQAPSPSARVKNRAPLHTPVMLVLGRQRSERVYKATPVSQSHRIHKLQVQ